MRFYPRQRSGNQATLVLWSDTGDFTRTVNFGPGASEASVIDMFGNAAPLAVNSSGHATISVGPDPVYVTVHRPAGAPLPVILRPVMDLPQLLRVVPGSTGHMDATVHNITKVPLSATVSLRPTGAAPVVPSKTDVTVPALGTAKVSLSFTAPDIARPWWPRAWTVFAPVPGDVDLARYTEIPNMIAGGGQTVEPTTLLPLRSSLDLTGFGGHGHLEKEQALCFATIDLGADMDTQIGASADYWMEWYVNGTRVYSTLGTGNAGPVEVLTHVFPVHLHKGRNLFAVRVLSGSAGWKLISGGPDAIAAAQREKAGATDSAMVELTSGQNLIARESLRVETLPMLDSRPEGASWESLAPDGVLGHVTNLFMAQPDSSEAVSRTGGLFRTHLVTVRGKWRRRSRGRRPRRHRQAGRRGYAPVRVGRRLANEDSNPVGRSGDDAAARRSRETDVVHCNGIHGETRHQAPSAARDQRDCAG